MKFSGLYLFFLALLLDSCIVPKDARKTRDSRRKYVDSEIVLQAYTDSPFSGSFLTLRANYTFEQTSSGFIKSYLAGDWKIKYDTIMLTYRDLQMNQIDSEVYLIDRPLNKLHIENDSLSIGGFRLMINKL